VIGAFKPFVIDLLMVKGGPSWPPSEVGVTAISGWACPRALKERKEVIVVGYAVEIGIWTQGFLDRPAEAKRLAGYDQTTEAQVSELMVVDVSEAASEIRRWWSGRIR